MKESDVEGLATHDGPESCGGVGNGAIEALTGVRTSTVSSCEIKRSGLPMSSRVQQATRRPPLCEVVADPAQSKTRRECRTFLRENREIPTPPALATRAASRRPEATRR